MKKLALEKETLRRISDGLSLVGGGVNTDTCTIQDSCGTCTHWDSDIVKVRVVDKEGK